MKVTLVLVTLCIGGALSSVVPIKGERKIADADFVKRQKMVLHLFSGLGHDETHEKEFKDFDFVANADKWTDPHIPTKFLEAFHSWSLDKDAIFTLNCRMTMRQMVQLFDLFFFAKDFDTFYQVASWAKAHMNAPMFTYAYVHALVHREDCHGFSIPPVYEVYPSYYVPTDALHKVYDAKMLGLKEYTVSYNTTGYEHSDHPLMFGGPLGFDGYNPHLEYKISYFREDVGISNWYMRWIVRFPGWMCPHKYNKSNWIRRGEAFYYVHQQFLARYINERYANMLPNIEPLYWDKPIRVGYNPRISYPNGVPFMARPDFYNPEYAADRMNIKRAMNEEDKLFEVISMEGYWNQSAHDVVDFHGNERIDVMGRFIYGNGSHGKKNMYYGKYFWIALDGLGSMVKTSDSKFTQLGAMANPLTAVRDPLYYSFLLRLMTFFQMQKAQLPLYTHDDLNFNGVSVKSFEVDKFVTFFDHFDYEVTNAVPVKDVKEYKDLKYHAQSYRLNHKPYNYKITVESDAAHDGIVRVFLGPEYNSMEQELSFEQKRFAYYELDRFPVKIAVGSNVFERNSKDAPFFSPDPAGYRELYEKLHAAAENKEPYYVEDKHSCGVPQRYQLPRGWHSGRKASLVVVVSPFENKYTGDEKHFSATCGSPKLFDQRPFGFPFDRPVMSKSFEGVNNIYFTDVLIYSKEEADVNRVE